VQDSEPKYTPPNDFCIRHRSHVDIRILFSAEDWSDYRAELVEMEPNATFTNEPADVYPTIVATAFLNGRWSCEFLRMGWLRDYLKSLLEYRSEGRTLEQMVKTQRAREDKLAELAETAADKAEARSALANVKIDLGDEDVDVF